MWTYRLCTAISHILPSIYVCLSLPCALSLSLSLSLSLCFSLSLCVCVPILKPLDRGLFRDDVDRLTAAAGALEFVPAMEYPDRQPAPPVWSMGDADGVHISEGAGPSSELLLPDKTTEAAAAAEGGQATPGAVEGADGRLSAPIVYASLVLGMIVVFKNAAGKASSKGQGSILGQDGHGGAAAAGRASVGGSTTATAAGGENSSETVAVWDERVSAFVFVCVWTTECICVCVCVCVFMCVRAGGRSRVRGRRRGEI